MLTSLLLKVVLAAASVAPGADAAPAAVAASGPAPVLATLHATAAPAPAASEPDACAGVDVLPDPGCGDAPLCTARQRAGIACGLRAAMQSRYVFYAVKGALLPASGGPPFDPRRALDACVLRERAIPREEDPLRFYDRMRRCVAAFEDGHLMLSAPAKLPQVGLGVALARAGGRVHVASRERALLGRDGPGMEDALPVGAEVVAVDGVPVGDAIADLERYVPGSSAEARLERAVDALTRRDFRFPERATAVLTLEVDGARRDVVLPWWISPAGPRHAMTRAYVRRTGIPVSDLVASRGQPVRAPGDAAWGDDPLRTDPVLPPRDAAALHAWSDERGRVAIRLGEVADRRDRAFCYLQILSFHTETLSRGGAREPFADVLAGFVRSCKEKGLDLALDLRTNGGGYIAHASALVSILAEPGRAYPGGALLLRANEQNEAVFHERAPASLAASEAEDELAPAHILRAIADARRAGAPFTPGFLETPLRASPSVGGYAGKVVALVSPRCMSVCDRVVAMLHASGRAVLVGGPTEGAGGSQQEAKDLPVRWTDPAGLVTVAIPNAAMGVQSSATRAPPPAAEAFFHGIAIENRPVPPDVPYAPTVRDLTEHGAGWLDEVERVLFEPRPAAGEIHAAASAPRAEPRA